MWKPRSPEPFQPVVDDDGVLLLVLDAPGGQVLDGLHSIGDTLQLAVQSGLQGPDRGLAAAAAGRHVGSPQCPAAGRSGGCSRYMALQASRHDRTGDEGRTGHGCHTTHNV